MSDKIEFKLDEKSKKLINSLFPERILKVNKGIKKIGQAYRSHRSKVFKKPSILDNNLKWEALNPFSQAYKDKKVGRGKPILTFTGKLGRSFSQKGAEGNVTIEKETSGEWGSKIIYAKFHKTGLPRRKIKSLKQLNFIRFGLGMYGKKLGSPIPLPKRDPSTPNLSEFNKYVKIIKTALLDNFKKDDIEVTK